MLHVDGKIILRWNFGKNDAGGVNKIRLTWNNI
jgi:hypothetical protein